MIGRNSETIVERRTKLLKMEGDGFSRPDIEKTLSVEFQVSERTVSRDFYTRESWQPQITSLSDRKQAYYSVLNRFEQIYKKASFTYLHSKNEPVTVSALKIMGYALSKIAELTNVTGEIVGDGITDITVTWKDTKLQEDLRHQEEFSAWHEKNLTPEEEAAYTTTARALIRFTLEKDRKDRGESLH